MAASKNFAAPDETRSFDKGQLDLIELNGQLIGRAVFQPGWVWSACVKPVVGTDSCQVEHLGYVESGQMGLRYDDGTTQEVGPGDLAHMPPGHDAWVVGDEPCVLIDFMGSAKYAVAD
jgi:hypothetical protein